jgi:hypothetical protein
MNYKESSRTTSIGLIATDGNFSYNTSYSYDANGNIVDLNCGVNQTVDGNTTYLGNMGIVASNGYQNVNLASGADLVAHVANFETIVAKIKADIKAATTTATASA